MKKIVLILLCLMLLAGCGGNPNVEPAATTPTATTAPVQNTPTDPTEDPFTLAESCIGKSVDDLIALIGDPDSTDYAPSCLVEGAEDGNWYYDGFTVYTIRTADGETVEYVE